MESKQIKSVREQRDEYEKLFNCIKYNEREEKNK